ncbi:MAG TPA: serine--tRNA ligase [Candidatus Limnocylindria bacterium]|nr:serine--tRNA ligase [Candidatus Limnocylindria bacterium]
MSVGLQRLRDDADAVRRGARDKGEDPAFVDQATGLDEQRRRLLGETDGLRAERKAISAAVGAAMKAGGGSEADRLRGQSTDLGSRIEANDARLAELERQIEELLLRIPNPADDDVPVGGPEQTRTVREWGEPLPPEADGWTRRPHWELAEQLGLIDLAAGASVTGSGFPFYRGAGARLVRALIGLFMDVHADEHGMTEIWPPALINATSARGTGQIPDKEDQMYVVERDGLYLNPTAEVAVTNIHRDQIIEPDRLPIRYVAYSPSFRREAGAAGRQTRGIVRVHQFDKVELVSFCSPAESTVMLEQMTAQAEAVLQRLGLAYRVRLMATGEMGFTQAKKYDLEAWAPAVGEWLEVSSISNFRDYQARRMNIRWRPAPAEKPEILHTLNGSGLAVPRTVAALLETYQQPDGSIRVPDALRPSLGGTIGA